MSYVPRSLCSQVPICPKSCVQVLYPLGPMFLDSYVPKCSTMWGSLYGTLWHFLPWKRTLDWSCFSYHRCIQESAVTTFFFQTWAHLCLRLKIPTEVLHIGMQFALIDVDSEIEDLLVSGSASLNMSSRFVMKLSLDLFAPHMVTWVHFQYFSIHHQIVKNILTEVMRWLELS